MEVAVHKVAMAAPNDISELAAPIDSSAIDPSKIIALIGKTEGNGGANDFTRGYATLSCQMLLAKHLKLSPEEIGQRVVFVWSGGTEGVLSPHATVFTRTTSSGQSEGTARLAMGIGITRDILPEEVGTLIQVHEVSAAVKRALGEAQIDDPRDVH